MTRESKKKKNKEKKTSTPFSCRLMCNFGLFFCFTAPPQPLEGPIRNSNADRNIITKRNYCWWRIDICVLLSSPDFIQIICCFVVCLCVVQGKRFFCFERKSPLFPLPQREYIRKRGHGNVWRFYADALVWQEDEKRKKKEQNKENWNSYFCCC